MERYQVRLPFQIDDKPRNLSEILEAVTKAGVDLGKLGKEVYKVDFAVLGGQPDIVIICE